MKQWTGWLALAATLCFLAACGAGPAAPAPLTPVATLTPAPSPTPDLARPGWTLMWHDEFDGPALDPAFWTRDVGGDGWGNGEAQYYTDRPENAFIKNGLLVIEALEENYQGKRFTSARLSTQDKVEQTYGRFEARIQIPTGTGIWPAFWLLGANIDEVSWPACGEIDIMENIGSEPGLVHGTVHGPGYAGGDGIGQSYALPGGDRFADAFHVYAAEWDPEAIRWFVDDVETHRLAASSVPGAWVFDHPFYIILNVAVGGQWPGYPDQTTVFPQRMNVDYVRVYAREGS